MDKKKLLNLINRQEGIKLDFKQKLDLYIESGRKELAKDICALANAKGGRGYIIIGIEDKTKKIIGIKEEDKFTEEQIQQIISSRCEPPIPISLENFILEGKDIAIITIYDGNQKPYQLRENGAFYIRRGSTTDTMRKQELMAAFEENLNFNLEACPVIRSSPYMLNMGLVEEYFNSKGIGFTEENKNLIMESASILYKDKESGDYKITLGGLLVFSDINSLYVPHNMIKIVNRINKNEDEVIIVEGNLLSMLDKSMDILNRILPKSYPIDAIFESVKNAVLYRDYSDAYKEIEVIISHNSTVVVSPGSLIEDKAWSENRSYSKRNMWIYEKLITLDHKKRFIQSGRGFNKMKKAFKNYGKVTFINSRNENCFKVIFPGINVLKNKQ